MITVNTKQLTKHMNFGKIESFCAEASELFPGTEFRFAPPQVFGVQSQNTGKVIQAKFNGCDQDDEDGDVISWDYYLHEVGVRITVFND